MTIQYLKTWHLAALEVIPKSGRGFLRKINFNFIRHQDTLCDLKLIIQSILLSVIVRTFHSRYKMIVGTNICEWIIIIIHIF